MGFVEYSFEFYEPGCKAVFRKYSHQEAAIREGVSAHVRREIDTDFAKTKLATRRHFDGHKVYECRVNLAKLPALRVAFALDGSQVTIVYMSTNIQKSEFSAEIESFLN